MNKYKSQLLLISLIIFLSAFAGTGKLHAQVFPAFNGKIYACDGKFTDSGGELNSYKANENIVTTICSDNPSKANTRLNFFSSDIKTGDELCIYDGFDLTAPLLTCSSDHNNFPFSVEASKANTSGCLTIQFKSNNFLQGGGWRAYIECVPQCQPVTANIDILSQGGNLNNGYLDICPGDPVELSANISFPQNDLNYHQDEADCSFDWVINNTLKLKGKSINLPQLNSGGYSVHLLVKDSFGCINNNTALQKIRVAPAPEFYINAYDSVLCLNKTLDLSASLIDDKSFDVSTKPGKGFFPAQDFLADTFALPDGTGKVYSSTIYVDRFDPLEVIDEIEDLESICFNIEHSFLKDLEISITCPSGQKITLQNQEPSPGSVFLGVPNEGDEILPAPLPGIGWDYCWSMTSSLGNWNDYLLKNSVATLPSNSYNPYKSFDGLIGCPLDGAWTIEIVDLWAKDNGYVYNWEINFNPNLYPSVDTFTNTLVSGQWLSNPGLLLNSGANITTTSLNAGRVENIWQVKDQSACKFEALVPVTFLPAQHPQCLSCTDLFKPLSDTIVCAGQIVNIKANENKNQTKSVDFSFYTSANFAGTALGVVNIPVNSIQPLTIGSPISDMSSVCLTLETDDLSTLGFRLLSPDGKTLELIKKGDIKGTNLKKTCFTPLAGTNIVTSVAPYSTNYKASGSWTSLISAVTSGNWKVQISKPVTQLVKLDSIQLRFNILQKVNLTWTSANNIINCPSCPVVNVPVTQKSNFILTAKDLYGCTQTDTSQVEILVAYPAPVVICNILGNGMIQFTWPALPGAKSYEVNVNGMGWEVSSGPLSHLISELKSGEVVTIQVRVSQIGIDCINEIGTTTCIYTECNLSAQAAVTPVSCTGKSDGSIKVNIISGKAPYIYSINGGTFTTSNVFNNLKEGSYKVVVTDIKYCKDTIIVTVGTAPKILANLAIDSVSCFGLYDGKVIANTSGGFAPFSYKWSVSPSPNVNTLSSLTAGNYKVTITDNKSCSTVESFTIGQPGEILATLNITNPLCAGMSSGTVKTIVAGGTSPYSFDWNTGSTSPDLLNLAKGQYDVTIEDANNCKIYKTATLTEPAALSIIPSSKSPSCFGINDGTCTIKASGGTAPYKYQWNDKNKSTTATAYNMAPGSYKVVITDANGCTATENFVLQDPPQLIVSVKAADEHCPNTKDGAAIVSIYSGNGPFNYTWSKPGIPNANIASGLAPGSYTVTISNSNGCSAEELFVINPAEPIIADITTEPVACPNSTNGQATVNVIGGYPPFFYFWNDPSNQLGATALSLNVGTYNVTVTDSRNCQLVVPATITAINPVSIIDYKISNTTCNNTTDGELSLDLAGGIAPYNIEWSSGLPKDQVIVSSLAKGTYDVTVTDAAGCYITQSFDVDSPLPVKSDFKSKPVTCLNLADGSLEVIPTGGTSPYTYIWSNGNVNSVNNNIAGGQYDVTVTDINGCTEISSSLVDAPLVQFDFDINQNFKACNGEDKNEAQVVITSSTGAVYSYNWSNGIQNQDNKSLKTGTYEVTVTDIFGCAVSKSLLIDDWDPILINYNTVAATCDNIKDASISISGISGGSANGDLSKYSVLVNGIPQGLTIGQLSSGQSNQVQIIDNQGCKLSDTIDIPVTEPIKYELTGSGPSCFSGANGSITVQNISGGNAPYNVNWNNGPVNPSYTKLIKGTYSFSIVDAKGCTKDGSFTLDEPAAIDLKNISITHNICEYDQKGEITVQPVAGVAPYTLSWSNGASGNTANLLSSGDYTVTVTDANNCTASSLINVSTKNKIEADALTVAPKCPGDVNGSIEMDVRIASQPVSFSLNNSNWQADNLFSGLAPGTYQCSIKDKEGCINKWDVIVENSALLNVSPLSNISLESGETTNLTADISSAGPVTVEWKSQEGNIFSCNTCPETEIRPTITGTCWLIAESETGCTVKIPFTVNIIKSNEIFVPTAFSPNQDGVNDRLSIFGKQGNIIKTFKVFDQWGELVYSISNADLNNDSQGWDGRFNNQAMNTGVFIWVADVVHKDGTSETLSGETTLLK